MKVDITATERLMLEMAVHDRIQKWYNYAKEEDTEYDKEIDIKLANDYEKLFKKVQDWKLK